jgi:cold shock CspA family protein
VLASPNDKSASLALAKALMRQDEFLHAESILSFLRRSFSDGDSHYEARFLFARCNVLYGDLARGNEEFKHLKSAYVEDKDRIAFPVSDSTGRSKRYKGIVISRPAGYGFMKCADLRFNAFFGRRNLTATDWESIVNGTEIEFTLSFSYRGPVATDLKILKGAG